jgi:competence protein ComEC
MASPLLPVTVAFCVGVFLSRWIHTSIPGLLIAASISLMTAWASYSRRQARLSMSLSILTFVLLGLLAPPMHRASYGRHHLRTLALTGKLDLSQPCRLAGICVKGSIPRGIGEQIELSVERIENRFSAFATEGRVRLALYYQPGETRLSQPLLNPGERIEVLANLRLPRNFNNPGQFDYVAYLERQEIALVGTIKNELLITRLAANQGSAFDRQIRELRRRLLSRLEESFAQSEAVLAVMKALLLGDKQALNPRVEEQFQATGLYHVLVISGQHIAVMGAFLYGFFKLVRVPRAVSVVLTLSGLALYTAITEAQPSVIRAALMACVFLIAVQFDRDRALLNSLSLAAGCLLWFDPFWLFDPGFQLSFLAVLAIGAIALPILRKLTRPWRNALWQIHDPAFDSQCQPRFADFRIWLRLKIESSQDHFPKDSGSLIVRGFVLPFRIMVFLAELLVVSLSIQLVFVVLMIIYFHRVSLVSVFLNLLAVPLVGLLVPLGFLLLSFSFAHLPLATLLATGCRVLAESLLNLAEYFSTPEWGNFRLPTPPTWLWAIYFFFLLAALLQFPAAVRRAGALMASGALGLMLLHPFAPRTPSGSMQLTFLDVRQGDSIFLSFPDQGTMVIDGGGLLGRSFGEHFGEERFDVGEQVVSPFLWSLGIRELDALVLTHAHHDHMSGLEALLKNFKVDELWVGRNPLVPDYLRLLKTSLQRSVPVRVFGTGDSLSFHSSRFEFLNPEKGSETIRAPSNNDSLAVRLHYGDRRFLLTGDIERQVETELLRDGHALESDLLKVAHHGSKSSTMPEFLDRVRPIWAVISVAAHSPFGHPHPEVIERLERRRIPAFRTDRHGAVTITTNGRTLEVRHHVENLSFDD